MIPLFSIIVPVYNCEDTVEKCLNSIRSQSEKNLEIIVIDDGSTDSSYQKIKQYGLIDSRIKLFRQNNTGVGGARNRALKIVKGEYVAFVDADDYIEEKYIEELYKAICKYKADISVCSDILQYENGKPVFKQRNMDQEAVCFSVDNGYSYVRDTSHVLSRCALYKKEILADVKFKTDLYVGEDTLFFAEAAKNSNKIVRIYTPLYHYVLYPESAFHGSFSERKLTEIVAWHRVCDLFKDNLEVYESAKCAYAIRCYFMIKRYYKDPLFNSKYYKDIIKKYRRNLIWFYKSKETSFFKKIFRTIFAVCPFICLFDKRN